MNITAAIVLFVMIWFMVFFTVLPQRFVSQEEAGSVVPGTPRSAPADAQIKRKAKLTTMIALGLWVVIAGIITSGWVTVDDFDYFGRGQHSAPDVTNG